MVCIDDHRILGRAERSDRTVGIDLVAKLDLLAHCLVIDRLAATLVLGCTPADLLIEARDEEELAVGIGEDDRADVAARHHDAPLPHLSLLLYQGFAHA